MVKRRAVVAMIAAALLSASCGSRGAGTTDTTTPPTKAESLEWKSCDGVECAELAVPLDYTEPSNETFSLKLSRQRALKPGERVGVLLVNPGGPGAPGRSLAQNAAYYFSRAIIDHFDIVAWDPRGTGESTPAIDCIDNYDDYFSEPFTAATAGDFVDACLARSGDILPFVGTANSARDIDAIRQALGEDRLSYFGFSYGGMLGLAWQSMFPTTVRAAVLDAPTSPTTGRSDRIARQANAFEDALDDFLRENNLAATFDSLAAKPPRGLTHHMILAAAISALYDEEAWPELAAALTDAARGASSGIRAMYEGYYYQDEGYEDYGDTFEASTAIACIDDVERKPIGDISDLAPRLHAFFAPDLLCTNWPSGTRESPDFGGRTTNPTLVIGATMDPASPLVGVKEAADAIGNARLITVDARRHTSYLAVDCVTSIVDDYLVDLVVPADTTCADQRTQT